LVNQDNLITKYIYNTSGKNNDRLLVVDKNEKRRQFICEDENKKKVILSYNKVFRDYTSITPLYVVSIKESDDKVGIVMNKYLSEWDDPENGYKYAYGMEIDIKEALKDEIYYKPNWMVYNRIDIDKSPKYKNAKTTKVVYGYYTTSLSSILFLLERYINLINIGDLYKVKEFMRDYINRVFGVQFFYTNYIYKKINDYKDGKDIDINISNIFNIPLNFKLIDRSSIKLLPYDFTIDLEKFKNYYTPYNIVILKTLDQGKVYIMGFHNKSVISGDIEYESPLNKDELSVLLDFNKG